MKSRLLAGLLLAISCGAAPTPEAEVRAVLATLEGAAEAGDASAFAKLVSASYQDPYGHDREKLRAFVAFHVMRSPGGREVIVRVRDVTLASPERAMVTLHVGLARPGLRGGGALGADVYAVDLDLAREDSSWRVSWAQWRTAPASDLL